MAIIQLLLISSIASLSFGKATDPSENKVNAFTGLRDCKNEYSVMCFKVDIANFVEKISKVDDMSILNGLNIVKDSTYNDSSSAIVAGKISERNSSRPLTEFDTNRNSTQLPK